MNTLYINGRFLTRPITGVERVALELIHSILGMADSSRRLILGGHVLNLEILTPRLPINEAYHSAVAKWPIRPVGPLSGPLSRGHFWEQLILPVFTQKGYLLSLANSAPVAVTRQSVFVHDAAIYDMPEAYSDTYRNFYKVLYQLLKIKRTPTLTNSLFSRQRISSAIGIPEAFLDVVRLGADSFRSLKPDNTILEYLRLCPKRYLLAVSSLQANKNVDGVIRALHALGSKAPLLVMVGSQRHPSFNAITQEKNPNFMHLGRVSDPQLAALYANAAGLVYPSFYEGFGLPPLEAIVSGALPLVSSKASLPEVCGSGALYCDPESPESIAQGMLKLINMSQEERERRLQELRTHTAQFTWNSGAIDVINHLALQLDRSAVNHLKEKENI